MRRTFLIALGVGAVALFVAFLAIGAFPPVLHQHEVQLPIATDSIPEPRIALPPPAVQAPPSSPLVPPAPAAQPTPAGPAH